MVSASPFVPTTKERPGPLEIYSMVQAHLNSSMRGRRLGFTNEHLQGHWGSELTDSQIRFAQKDQLHS
jgi:hypothetical protein